jgi:hypothetical protein
MPSAALIRFQKSVADHGWHQYREGEGYDLDAVRQVTPAEADGIIDQMLAAANPGWVEVEVLDAIGTERSLGVLRGWMDTHSIECAMAALAALHRRRLIDDAIAEAVVLGFLPRTTILQGLVRVLEWAGRLATPRIKRMVLWCAAHGQDGARPHSAALAHHLYGVTKTNFDWSRRDFYLRFNDPADAVVAYGDLCAEVGETGQGPDEA